jgi:hypothetical protein
MTQDEIIDTAIQAWADAGEGWVVKEWFADRAKAFEAFAKLVAAKEREVHEHDMGVLMDALWKACGDDEEVVNATIESQGTLIKARGEQA